MSSWLVTGGAGYIGAHVVAALTERGERAVVLDDLSTGTPERIGDTPLVVGGIEDYDLVVGTLKDHDVRGVIHIAAKKQVGESVARPLWYYRQNLVGQLTVLEAAVAAGVESVVFSSSASTYGLLDVDVITEDMAGRPLSPYGETKLAGEWLGAAAAAAGELKVVSLRYFNVAGCARPKLGDPGVANLIPMALRALTSGQAPKVFGDDYPTPDGTCIRDYIHVADLADAHVAALEAVAAGTALSPAYNVGRGVGSSVREVLDVVADVTGLDREPEVVARRPGDPARSVASVDLIRRELLWTARYDLTEMVASAWDAWQVNPPR